MSTEPDDTASPFTNYGNASVHLGAPGRACVTTASGVQGYSAFTGSSFAAPLVAGVAALALSVLGAAEGSYYNRTAQARERPGLGSAVRAAFQPPTPRPRWCRAQVRSVLLGGTARAPTLQCASRGRVSANSSVALAVALATSASIGAHSARRWGGVARPRSPERAACVHCAPPCRKSTVPRQPVPGPANARVALPAGERRHRCQHVAAGAAPGGRAFRAVARLHGSLPRAARWLELQHCPALCGRRGESQLAGRGPACLALGAVPIVQVHLRCAPGGPEPWTRARQSTSVPRAYHQPGADAIAGALLCVRTHVLLNSTGVWGFRVLTSAPRTSFRLLVNGKEVPLSSSGQGALLAQATGPSLTPHARRPLALTNTTWRPLLIKTVNALA